MTVCPRNSDPKQQPSEKDIPCFSHDLPLQYDVTGLKWHIACKTKAPVRHNCTQAVAKPLLRLLVDCCYTSQAPPKWILPLPMLL